MELWLLKDGWSILGLALVVLTLTSEDNIDFSKMLLTLFVLIKKYLYK
jgi:hypothetical protein